MVIYPRVSSICKIIRFCYASVFNAGKCLRCVLILAFNGESTIFEYYPPRLTAHTGNKTLSQEEKAGSVVAIIVTQIHYGCQHCRSYAHVCLLPKRLMKEVVCYSTVLFAN